jgi:hypothetical protein
MVEQVQAVEAQAEQPQMLVELLLQQVDYLIQVLQEELLVHQVLLLLLEVLVQMVQGVVVLVELLHLVLLVELVVMVVMVLNMQ